MPTYDYECGNCQHSYELFQQITAKPVKKCPECGRNTATRLIGAGASIIFKGSGFYQTDYRSESYKKAAKADTEKTSEKSTKDTSTKTESSSSNGKSDNNGSKS